MKSSANNKLLESLLNKPLICVSKDGYYTPNSERIISKRLAYNEEFINIRKYLPNKYTNFPKYIKEVLTFKKCAPSNELICIALKKLVNLNSETISLEKTIDDFIFSKNELRLLYILGHKGVGKTTLINNYFNLRNTSLFNTKFLWFRLDAWRIYESWDNYKELINEGDNLFRKFIQIKFCLTSIASQSNKLFKNLGENPEETYMPYLRGRLSDVENFEKKIKEIKRFTTSEANFSYLSKLYFSYKDDFDVIDNLFEAIKSYLLDNKMKFIVIIDGLDNINFHKYIDKYNNTLEQLKSFLFVDEDNNLFHKTIVCFRNPTHQHFINLFSVANEFNGNKIKHQINWSSTKEIIKQKRKHMSPPLEYFKSDYQTLLEENNNIQDSTPLNKIKNQCFSLFNNFIDIYVYELKKLLKHTIENNNVWSPLINKIYLKDLDLKDNELIKIIFHNNFRNYIYNLNYAFHYHLLNTNNGGNSKAKEHVVEQFLLRGKSYYSTEKFAKSSNDKGLLIPNIFHFYNTENKDLNNWHGLCGLRIIQLAVKKRVQGIYWSDTVTILNELFNYDSQIINTCIHELTKHRILEPEYVSHSTFTSDRKKNFDKYYLSHRKIRITSKGILTVPLIFSEIKILYYFFLDTPLPVSTFDTYNLIRTHRNSKNNGPWKDGYIESLITSSLTFMRLIKSQAEIDNIKLENLNHILIKEKIDMLTFEINNKIYYDYIKNASKLLDKLKNKRKDEILKDLKGLI